MTRLLITGANGFIGRHCLGALRAHDLEIHATTTRSDISHSRFAHWHHCDLLDREAAQHLIAEVRPTHLLHLAWIATPGVYWTSPLNEAWGVAGLQLAESFVSAGGERMIVTGTCAEYDWSNGVCVEAEHHPNPSSPYAKAKLALSLELAELAGAAGISLAWPRLFWTYGPFEPQSRLIPSIILSLLRDEPSRCTTGTHCRDYLHVTDVARALASVVCSSLVGPVNVASGTAPTIATIATAISTAMNKTQLLRLGAIVPDRAEEPLVVADIGRLENEIGFHPRISLETGLRETIQWWTENIGHENDRSTTSSDEPQPEGVGIA